MFVEQELQIKILPKTSKKRNDKIYLIKLKRELIEN